MALPSPCRAAALVKKTPKVGVPDKKVPVEPASILRRGWHHHPAGRAAGESIARLGTRAAWLLLGKMDVATGNVAQQVPRSGFVLGDGQGIK